MNQPAQGSPNKFRFQSWMLGALIVPVGIGLSARDVLKADSIELGGECSDSKHCKSHTCLTGGTSVCTQSCSKFDPCPNGFSCEAVSVTLRNSAGHHDLGDQSYCMRASVASVASASVASAVPTQVASVAASSAAPPPAPEQAAAPSAPEPKEKRTAAPTKATKRPTPRSHR